jgi:hypothetical protein
MRAARAAGNSYTVRLRGGCTDFRVEGAAGKV